MAEWPNLQLLRNTRRLSSSGRNVGFRASIGKYILFLDGHCFVPRQDYLVRLVELFESTKALCLCRPQPLDFAAEGAWARAIAAARHSWLGHAAGSDIYGAEATYTSPRSAGAAYMRSTLERVGGYDERFDACEDVELNYRVERLGEPSYCHPDLTVHYRPRSTPRAFLQQMVRYGRGRARLFAKHHRLVPLPFMLSLAFGAFALILALALGISAFIRIATSIVMVWCLMILAETFRVSTRASQAPRVFLSFAIIHLGLTLGIWLGFIDQWHRKDYRAPDPETLDPAADGDG